MEHWNREKEKRDSHAKPFKFHKSLECEANQHHDEHLHKGIAEAHKRIEKREQQKNG